MELNLEHMELQRLSDVSNKVIKTLILNKNYLRYICSEYLPSTLEHLSLDENDLSTIEFTHPLPHLKTLSVDTNRLKFIEFTQPLQQLHTFSAKQNSFWNTAFLLDMPALKHLTISQNDLKVLQNLPSTLQTLSAKLNKIQMIQSRLPDGLLECNLLGNSLRMGSLPLHWGTNLRVLNLGYNSLKEFPKRLPDSLEDLRLMNNQIESIPSRLPSSLKRMALTGNKLRELPQTTSVRLELLIVSHNQLTQDFQENPISWVIHCFEERNWNQFKHQSAQVIIKRCWKHYLLKMRLRQLVRNRRIYNELLMVTLHPDHVLQTDIFSPEWSKTRLR